MLKSEKRESQKFKKRYGPRRHKMLGINKWTRKRKEIRGNSVAYKLQTTEPVKPGDNFCRQCGGKLKL